MTVAGQASDDTASTRHAASPRPVRRSAPSVLRRGSIAHQRIAVVVCRCTSSQASWSSATWLLAIPDIISGKRVIVGDELVPYFNPRSQLLEQAQGKFNELTNGYEFRVRYAFLTTWLRHYMVLPFALLLVLPTIVSSAYITTAWFMRRSFLSPPTRCTSQPRHPTAVIYMIMIYAKVTHFYTLVLGLCLMTISAFLMMDALLFRETRWGRRMIAACLVTLLNPAVHYLVLFALFLGLAVVTLVVGETTKSIRSGAARLSAGVRAARRMRRTRLREFLRSSGRRGRIRALVGEDEHHDDDEVRVGTGRTGDVRPDSVRPLREIRRARGRPDLFRAVPGTTTSSATRQFTGHILSWDLAGIMDKINSSATTSARSPGFSNILYTAVDPGAGRSYRGAPDPVAGRPQRQLFGVLYVNVRSRSGPPSVTETDLVSDLPPFHRGLDALGGRR